MARSRSDVGSGGAVVIACLLSGWMVRPIDPTRIRADTNRDYYNRDWRIQNLLDRYCPDCYTFTQRSNISKGEKPC